MGSKKICRSIIEFDTAESATLLCVRNDEGETPLFLAALHGHIDVFLYLHFKCHPGREHFNYCIRKNGDTILHCAISEEHYGELYMEVDYYY